MELGIDRSMNMDLKANSRMSKLFNVGVNYKLLSLSYLLPSWSLLLWLNFSIEPNLFAHFIAIPSLLLFTGFSAYLIAQKSNS